MSIHADKNGPVTTITLSRPDVRNAVDRETAEALVEAFQAFDADPSARAAVLYGDHGTFCAGADLKAIAAGRPNRMDPTGPGPMGPTRMLLQKPVVAAIAGYAVGGGMELALWCDLRVMEADAVLGFFNRRWGIPLIDGGTIRLPRLIGLSRALDLILTGRAIEADEAFNMGLVHRIAPKGTARQAAEALAHELAQFPQVCLRGDRLSAYEQFDLRLEDALANEFKHGQAALHEESLSGAERFTRGAGRHGGFNPAKS